MNMQLSWIVLSSQCGNIFISFQVKQQDTDWIIRKKKAGVSELDLHWKQSL